jgi:NAD(P)H-hydrate epimerase
MSKIEGFKVVTVEEMARIEKKAIETGFSEEAFVEEAGRKIALAALAYIEAHQLPKSVYLLIGKGNNGSDAYSAGIQLLQRSIEVRAFVLFEESECHAENQKWGERFQKKGGSVEREVNFEGMGLILDGFLGSGFNGRVEPLMAEAIERAVESGKPILAIDIPSGLNGSTGKAEGTVIQATQTIALGLPKIGFFIRQGWNCVGDVRVEDFGLPQELVDEAEAVAYLPNWTALKLPPMIRTRHKYQAGYVVGFAGSRDFSGAPKLAGLAALRAGAGIVRVFSLEELGPGPVELIANVWSPDAWKEALSRAQALFIGPGLGRSKEAHKWLERHLKEIRQPCVLDADALLPDRETFPAQAILTPHRGEVLRLLGLQAGVEEEALWGKIADFCEKTRAVLVLKGAPTMVFAPGKKPVIIPRGDPGMATAGSGDVLTGILAALLAQGMGRYEAAVLGVTLHAIAGEKAAREKTSYCMIASDLIEALPKAFQG